MNVFNQVSKYGEEARRIVESAQDEFSVPQMRELMKETSDMPLILADFIKAFIALAKACSEVTILEGLMDDLKETDTMVYDFVMVMKNAYVPNNRVKIDGSYFRFFKTYEHEIFKGIKPIDLERARTSIEKTKRNAV